MELDRQRPLSVGSVLAHCAAFEKWKNYPRYATGQRLGARPVVLTSHAPPCPRTQARSCLAEGWHGRATEDPYYCDIGSLRRAGSIADGAVSLGLINTSRAASMTIRDQPVPRTEHGQVRKVDRSLEAIDKRSGEVDNEKLKQDAEMSKTPLRYVCVAKDWDSNSENVGLTLVCGPFNSSCCSN